MQKIYAAHAAPGSIAVRQAAELGALLPKAQLLFICLPHTAETEALIGERELSLLPENAVIVNVGRHLQLSAVLWPA